MPVALDPNERYRYVFSTDRSKPEGTRPTLLFRYPTCRETRIIANLFDDADAAQTVGDQIRLSCDAIRTILVGWENFTKDGKPVPYDPQELDAVLTEMDFIELRGRLFGEMSQSETEKKRYAFSAESSGELAAKSASAANASMPLQKTNPLSSSVSAATDVTTTAPHARDGDTSK